MNPYLPNNNSLYQNPYLSSPYQNKLDIVHVNGENGAKAYQMPANSNTLLLDDTAPIVWLAQTDGAGYKTVTPYSITPYKPEPPVDIKELENRITKLEDLLNDKSKQSDVIKAEPHTDTWKSSEYKTDDKYF
ncbi:MAG: hypothetical protein IKP50_00050 [Bacilli bacterium]|nr:hypothetical protein [Bacilli bacterium]